MLFHLVKELILFLTILTVRPALLKFYVMMGVQTLYLGPFIDILVIALANLMTTWESFLQTSLPKRLGLPCLEN